MTWFRIDDGFLDHPKVLGLSPEALTLWLKAGLWCSRHLTDGLVPEGVIHYIGMSNAEVIELVQSGLWLEADDGGYLFHDWHHYQPSREEVEAKRQANRDAVARHRQKKRSGNARVMDYKPMSNAVVIDPRPDPTPTPLKDSSSLADASDAAPDLFAEFWTAYPRKVGKDAARKSWAKAVKRADPQHIIAAALRFRRDPNLPADRGFIPHPATWLNQGRWDDEPLPERSNGTKAPSGAAMFVKLANTLMEVEA